MAFMMCKRKCLRVFISAFVCAHVATAIKCLSYNKFVKHKRTPPRKAHKPFQPSFDHTMVETAANVDEIQDHDSGFQGFDNLTEAEKLFRHKKIEKYSQPGVLENMSYKDVCNIMLDLQDAGNLFEQDQIAGRALLTRLQQQRDELENSEVDKCLQNGMKYESIKEHMLTYQGKLYFEEDEKESLLERCRQRLSHLKKKGVKGLTHPDQLTRSSNAPKKAFTQVKHRVSDWLQ